MQLVARLQREEDGAAVRMGGGVIPPRAHLL